MSFMNSSLFSSLLFVILFSVPVSADVDIESDKLPLARDLLAESRQAACNGQPLVVMFGSTTCPYCSVVRSLYIIPLMNDERYPGIVSRELEIDSDELVRDFSGKLVRMTELASKYNVTLVPQVMIFGPSGKQAGKPIIGISSEDFYGYYLDQAILAGIEMVRQKSTAETSGNNPSTDVPSASPGGYVCD
jgi:thioredoxin-related protein